MASQTALVTGGTSGIGYEIARQLAARGHGLILASRNELEMRRLAERFRQEHGVETTPFRVDLAVPGSAAELHDRCREAGFTVDVLVNNAGFGKLSPHIELSPEVIRGMGQLNMLSLAELCSLFGGDMARRGRGRILNVASLAGYGPLPYCAEYAATKSFVLSFSEALAAELAERGVTVTCLCPGPTATNFNQTTRTGPDGAEMFRQESAMDAAEVARTGVEALFEGRRVVIPGGRNRLMAGLMRHLPTDLTLWFMGRSYRRRLTGNPEEAR
ncbi:MAG: SDR family oxidoreductase [Armatimonadetes bacterium]|nr:SDR family oxidoreductase [Armatimonadota bacterium]